LSARGRNITLIAAGALLVIALILAVSIAGDDPLADVAEEINAFGYSLTPEDFYVLGGAGNTSIAALLEKDEAELAPVIEASRACGFPSDTLAIGDITALLANTVKRRRHRIHAGRQYRALLFCRPKKGRYCRSNDARTHDHPI